jgi:hypothetical protein
LGEFPEVPDYALPRVTRVFPEEGCSAELSYNHPSWC